MKCSRGVYLLVSIFWMMGAGCESFESTPPEETRTEYSLFVKDKMDKLRYAHARLIMQVQQEGLDTKHQTILNATLDDLTQRREAVKRQIETMKMAKGPDWFAIQFVMNHDLEELAQSYDQAFVEIPG